MQYKWYQGAPQSDVQQLAESPEEHFIYELFCILWHKYTPCTRNSSNEDERHQAEVTGRSSGRNAALTARVFGAQKRVPCAAHSQRSSPPPVSQ